VVEYTLYHQRRQPLPLLLKVAGLEEVDEDKEIRMDHSNNSWVWLVRILKK
jgi:hypothetical protein